MHPRVKFFVYLMFLSQVFIPILHEVHDDMLSKQYKKQYSAFFDVTLFNTNLTVKVMMIQEVIKYIYSLF
jgi:hypothetical protein